MRISTSTFIFAIFAASVIFIFSSCQTQAVQPDPVASLTPEVASMASEMASNAGKAPVVLPDGGRLKQWIKSGVKLLDIESNFTFSVSLSHFPPGNPNNCQTQKVNLSKLKAHFAHGDRLGPCTGDADNGSLPIDTINAAMDDFLATLPMYKNFRANKTYVGTNAANSLMEKGMWSIDEAAYEFTFQPEGAASRTQDIFNLTASHFDLIYQFDKEIEDVSGIKTVTFTVAILYIPSPFSM